MCQKDQPNRVAFNFYDNDAAVDRTSRDLPHWFQVGTVTFITFRTHDSLPRSVSERNRRELEDWLQREGHNGDAVDSKTVRLPLTKRKEYQRLSRTLKEASLDKGYGECHLRSPKIAAEVSRALLYFVGDRYDLDSFIVMPNHVHLLIQFRHGTTLTRQTESWLRYSARQINRLLGRTGPFWQSEPFDHLVRSPEQFVYLQQYIRDNPSKAQLGEGEYLYWRRPQWHDSPSREAS